MLDLALSDEQTSLQEVGSRIGIDVLDAAAREAQATRNVPAAVWSTLLETGVVAPVPEEHGGGGVPDVLTYLVGAEALAYGDPAIAAAGFWSGAAAALVAEAGTAAQQAELLPPFVTDAGLRSAVALYEGYGRAPSEYATTIQAVGLSWKVSGQKVAVPFGEWTGPLLVVGTDPSSGGRLRVAVVPADAPGLVVSSVSVHAGLDAVPLATISLDVDIPADGILGGSDSGVAVLAGAIARLRLLNAALALGAGRRAREYASSYALDRVAFGRPIAAFQGVSFLLAEAEIKLEAARTGLWQVASSLDGRSPEAVEQAVSAAVGYAGSVSAEVARDALQVLGGHGFITDHPVERWYRATVGLSSLDFDPLVSPASPAF